MNTKLYNCGGEFYIDVKDVKVTKAEIETVHNAWAEGRPVQMGCIVKIGKRGIGLYFYISNALSSTYIHPNAINITRDWLRVKLMLEKNQIPSEWMELLIEKLREELNHVR